MACVRGEVACPSRPEPMRRPVRWDRRLLPRRCGHGFACDAARGVCVVCSYCARRAGTAAPTSSLSLPTRPTAATHRRLLPRRRGPVYGCASARGACVVCAAAPGPPLLQRLRRRWRRRRQSRLPACANRRRPCDCTGGSSRGGAATATAGPVRAACAACANCCARRSGIDGGISASSGLQGHRALFGPTRPPE
jgi:hypothetical protein